MGLKGSGGPCPCWWSIMDSTVLSGGHHSSLSRVFYIVFIRLSFSRLHSLTYGNIIRDICLERNEKTRFFHILVNSVVYFTLHNYVQKSCTSGILDHQMILNQYNWIMNANQYCFYFQNCSKYHLRDICLERNENTRFLHILVISVNSIFYINMYRSLVWFGILVKTFIK